MHKAITAATLALLALQPAFAQDKPRYYGAIHLGQNNLEEWPASVDFGGPTTPGQLKLDRSLHFGIIAGREKDQTRFEIEYQRGRAKIEQVALGAVTQAASGSGRYQALTVGAYRVFELNPALNAFIGLGIGWGSVSLPQLAPVGACNCFAGAKDSGFVWQARIGAEYEFGRDQAILAQYTLLRLPGPSASGGAPTAHYGSKRVGAFSVGYRNGF